jgi:hypothetical protein
VAPKATGKTPGRAPANAIVSARRHSPSGVVTDSLKRRHGTLGKSLTILTSSKALTKL